MTRADLREKLAEQEHEQWVGWAKSIIASEKISEKRALRWQTYFVPYSELEESVKDQDRKHADATLQLLDDYFSSVEQKYGK